LGLELFARQRPSLKWIALRKVGGKQRVLRWLNILSSRNRVAVFVKLDRLCAVFLLVSVLGSGSCCRSRRRRCTAAEEAEGAYAQNYRD
jgi:hypothetical protein